MGYSAIREAVLERRRKAVAIERAARRSGKSSRAITAVVERTLERPGSLRKPDDRPPPLPAQSDRETKVRGLLERGMGLAVKTRMVQLKARLVAANTNLRRELIRARKMRRRFERSAYNPEQLGEQEGLAWLYEQLMELGDEARDVGDTAGALAAYRTLAVLAGHMQERRTSTAGTAINLNLVEMIRRLDAEEQAAPGLIEEEASRHR